MGSALDSGIRVTVCIPWREGPGRLEAFLAVTAWYRARGYEYIACDSDSEQPFNLSQARNTAVNAARRVGADIVVVGDADTVPDEWALRRAIETNTGEVTYPFDKYVYLKPVDHPATDHLELMEVDREYPGSVGGLFVTTPETYWSVGGMDEEFRQWGYEDRAFYYAAQTLGRIARVNGSVYAFGHDAERDMSSQNPGKHRVALYHFARSNPDVMRELVKSTRT